MLIPNLVPGMLIGLILAANGGVLLICCAFWSFLIKCGAPRRVPNDLSGWRDQSVFLFKIF